MPGGLEILRAALASGGRDAARAVNAIGDRFYQAADDVPDMFQRGRQFGHNRWALGDQFGVHFAPNPEEPGQTLVNTPGLRISDMATMTESPYDKAIADEVFGGSLRHARELGNRTMVGFDTSGLYDPNAGYGQFSGAGAGRGVYGAMFGSLLDDPDKLNYVTSLSARNQHRRNYNQAAALLRDPRLSRQILTDPFQVKHTERPIDQLDFLNMPPEHQVGTFQAEGALQTLNRLERLARNGQTFDEMRSPIRDIYEDIIPHSYDPYDFTRAAGILRRSGASPELYDTIGASALKRAALVHDIAAGTPDARAHLFSGLEFRRGGGV